MSHIFKKMDTEQLKLKSFIKEHIQPTLFRSLVIHIQTYIYKNLYKPTVDN